MPLWTICRKLFGLFLSCNDMACASVNRYAVRDYSTIGASKVYMYEKFAACTMQDSRFGTKKPAPRSNPQGVVLQD